MIKFFALALVLYCVILFIYLLARIECDRIPAVAGRPNRHNEMKCELNSTSMAKSHSFCVRAQTYKHRKRTAFSFSDSQTLSARIENFMSR